MVGTLGWRSAPAQSSLGIDALQRLRIVAATVEKEDGRRGASIEGAPAFVLRAAGAVCRRSIEHTLHGHIGSHRDRAGSDRRRRRSAASRGQSGCSRSRKARGGVGARAGCVPEREVSSKGGERCLCVRSGGRSGAAESRWGGRRRTLTSGGSDARPRAPNGMNRASVWGWDANERPHPSGLRAHPGRASVYSKPRADVARRSASRMRLKRRGLIPDTC